MLPIVSARKTELGVATSIATYIFILQQPSSVKLTMAKEEDDGVDEINHRTHHSQQTHNNRHAPVETWPALEMRRMALGEVSKAADVVRLNLGVGL